MYPHGRVSLVPQGAWDRGLMAHTNNRADAAGGCTAAVFLQNLQVFDLYTLRGFLSEVQIVAK